MRKEFDGGKGLSMCVWSRIWQLQNGSDCKRCYCFLIKEKGCFQFLKMQNWFAIFDFLFPMLFWNGKHKWNESGPNLVNYTDLVSETVKLTKLCWPCVYGVAETNRTENEQGKSFSNLNETINKKQNKSKYPKLRKQTFW